MNRYLLFFLICTSLQIFSQEIEFVPSDFRVTGDAYTTGDNCFKLTMAKTWQGGSVWFKNPIDLNEKFEMEIDLFFGCSDQGADGIVFMFHDRLANGWQGEGMGFGGLRPSFGIEMDTYHNPRRGDPFYDHIALMENGNLNHYDKPIPILSGEKNIEDCKKHRVAIIWNPSEKRIKISIDGDVRINKVHDIVGNVFSKNSIVYWGFSAATGGSYNDQRVCLEKLDFVEVGQFDKSTQKKLLEGETYSLKNVEFPPSQTELEPEAYIELNKVVRLMKKNPHLEIYVNAHTDSSGSASMNQNLSNQRAEAVAKYLKERGISKNRIHAEGRGEAFPKTRNDTAKGRKINRRVDVYLIDPRA